MCSNAETSHSHLTQNHSEISHLDSNDFNSLSSYDMIVSSVGVGPRGPPRAILFVEESRTG